MDINIIELQPVDIRWFMVTLYEDTVRWRGSVVWHIHFSVPASDEEVVLAIDVEPAVAEGMMRFFMRGHVFKCDGNNFDEATDWFYFVAFGPTNSSLPRLDGGASSGSSS